MVNFKTTVIVNGKKHDTLADILPEKGKLKILFIAKTPATESVKAGHYFQGGHGKNLWAMLKAYGILRVTPGMYEDEVLLEHKYGITDIVKVPRDFGNEPSKEEYREGMDRILETIKKYQPKVIVFIYKAVLDNILSAKFNVKQKSVYGFNSDLNSYFGSRVFVFPMPGTPCTKAQKETAMEELQMVLNSKLKPIVVKPRNNELLSLSELLERKGANNFKENKETGSFKKGCGCILIVIALITLYVLGATYIN